SRWQGRGHVACRLLEHSQARRAEQAEAADNLPEFLLSRFGGLVDACNDQPELDLEEVTVELLRGGLNVVLPLVRVSGRGGERGDSLGSFTPRSHQRNQASEQAEAEPMRQCQFTVQMGQAMMMPEER